MTEPSAVSPEPVDLDEVRRRVDREAIPDGPWGVEDGTLIRQAGTGTVMAEVPLATLGPVIGRATAEFIAAARTLVPQLAAEVERLRSEAGTLYGTAAAYMAEVVELRDARKQRNEALAALAGCRALLAEEDQAVVDTIRERDHAEGWADRLAGAVSALMGVDIGEHSSAHNPWAVALDALQALTVAPAVTTQGEITDDQS
jgi:hypothetical protein